VLMMKLPPATTTVFLLVCCAATARASLAPPHDKKTKAQHPRMTMDEVPVIDVSRIVSGAPTPEDVDAIDLGCRFGFFHVRGHGIERRIIENFDSAMRWFFALPEAEKKKYRRSRDCSRGFANDEFTKNTRDVKELYDFGHVPRRDLDFDAPENRVLDGYNRAPPDAFFRTALLEYYDACAGVCRKLMTTIAAALHLEDPEAFDDEFFGGAHTSFLRLNFYPPLPRSAERFDDAAADLDRIRDGNDDQPDDSETPLAELRGQRLGVNRHFDAGGVTLLRQDPSVSALQFNADAHKDDGANPRWIDVAPPQPLNADDFPLTVNVADMLQVLSNDRYEAAEHRVLATRGDAVRYSAPFFYNPRYDATIKPLRSPARYQPFTYGDFRRRRFEGDFENQGKPEIQIADFRIPPTGGDDQAASS